MNCPSCEGTEFEFFPRCLECGEHLDPIDAPPSGDGGLREIERAYSMLGIEGVSRERARSVANGISVLATRWRKEVACMEEALGALTKVARAVAEVSDEPNGIGIVVVGKDRMDVLRAALARCSQTQDTHA